MSDKPTYLGLLNAIAVGENRGFELLDAWSKATDNKELKSVLNVIAIREREHAAAFTKRICELGFGVREMPRKKFKVQLKLAHSNLSDKKKFKQILRISRTSSTSDPFSKMFEDTTIDPQTGALLGRYIAEERDSGRRLRTAYDLLKGAKGDQAREDIAQRLDKLSEALEELRELRH